MQIQKFNIALKPSEVILPLWLEEASTSAGKTGLAYNTSGLTIAFGSQFGGATPFTIEPISDLSFYEAPPNQGACRFAQYDASSLPGLYFLFLPVEFFAFEGSSFLLVRHSSIKPAAAQLRVAEPVGQVDGALPPTGLGPFPATSSTNNSVTVEFLTFLGLPDEFFLRRLLYDRSTSRLAAITDYEGSTGKLTVRDIGTDDGDWGLNPSAGDDIYILNGIDFWHDVERELTSARGAGDPLANPVPGDYEDGSAGAALARLAGASVQTVSPISADGELLRLVRGDSYLADNNRSIRFVKGAGSNWPADLSGWTPWLTIRTTLSPVEVEGSVITATGDNQSVRFELAPDDSNSLSAGSWTFTVSLINGDDVVTIIGGQAIVEKAI